MMSNLQRNFGRLYAAQQRYNEALQAFATDIYYSGLEFGPENIRSAPSYFHMGRVFQSHQKSDRASSFYMQFLENWLNSEQPAGGEFEITAVEVEEAIEIVKHITEYREKRGEEEQTERAHVETAEGRYTLGLLLIFTGDLLGGKDCLSTALEVFLSTMGIDHSTTRKCQNQLERLEEKIAREALTQGGTSP